MRVFDFKRNLVIRKRVTNGAVKFLEIILSFIEIAGGDFAFGISHGRFHKRIFFERIGKGKADFTVLAVFVIHTVGLAECGVTVTANGTVNIAGDDVLGGIHTIDRTGQRHIGVSNLLASVTAGHRCCAIAGFSERCSAQYWRIRKIDNQRLVERVNRAVQCKMHRFIGKIIAGACMDFINIITCAAPFQQVSKVCSAALVVAGNAAFFVRFPDGHFVKRCGNGLVICHPAFPGTVPNLKVEIAVRNDFAGNGICFLDANVTSSHLILNVKRRGLSVHCFHIHAGMGSFVFGQMCGKRVGVVNFIPVCPQVLIRHVLIGDNRNIRTGHHDNFVADDGCRKAGRFCSRCLTRTGFREHFCGIEGAGVVVHAAVRSKIIIRIGKRGILRFAEVVIINRDVVVVAVRVIIRVGFNIAQDFVTV